MNRSIHRPLRSVSLSKFVWFALLVATYSPECLLAEKILLGRVINGTFNKPALAQRVELLTLGEGMNRNSETQSAADGSFEFSVVDNKSSPHWLLRAIYEGVNYNLSVTPDQDLSQAVVLTIYQTTESRKGIEVSLPLMLAQASGNSLFVQQQYFLNNSSVPKKTLTSTTGTFAFDTPSVELTSELAVSVVGLAGIPLPQQPTPLKEGGYAINYPMKPGLNEVRVSYKVNFPSSERDFSHRLFYDTGATRVLVLPANLQATGPNLRSAGSDSRTQAAVYEVAPLKNSRLEFLLSGNAPQVAEERSDPGEQGQAEPQVEVVRLSNRVFESRVFILSGFGAVFVIFILLAIRQKMSGQQRRK